VDISLCLVLFIGRRDFRCVRRIRPKHSDNVLDRNDVQQIVRFEIDWDCFFRMKQDLVVFTNREIIVSFNLNADFDHATSDRRDFGSVRKNNSTARCLPTLILANQDSHSEWFNEFGQSDYLLLSLEDLNFTAKAAYKFSQGVELCPGTGLRNPRPKIGRRTKLPSYLHIIRSTYESVARFDNA
jgi:hypothetical protein